MYYITDNIFTKSNREETNIFEMDNRKITQEQDGRHITTMKLKRNKEGRGDN